MAFSLCNAQEAVDKLEETVSGGRGLAVTLKESDVISYRGEELLLSSVRGLSEAKPSCVSHCFAFKQYLSPLDIPDSGTEQRNLSLTADCTSKIILRFRTLIKEMSLN